MPEVVHFKADESDVKVCVDKMNEMMQTHRTRYEIFMCQIKGPVYGIYQFTGVGSFSSLIEGLGPLTLQRLHIAALAWVSGFEAAQKVATAREPLIVKPARGQPMVGIDTDVAISVVKYDAS